MKKLISILFLTATAAFAQPEVAPPAPTIDLKWLAPDCSGKSFLEELSSGCAFASLQVAATSPDPKVSGFYVLVTFTDAFGLPEWRQAVVTTKNAGGSFVAAFVLGPVTDLKVSALELFPGRIAYAQQASGPHPN